ncbi:hypothetical protein KEJ39_00925 [Candidatus Bathyarchaeota archaeon]|nr:hypothetical protein [Candidatus Bathyarchaeota archaeon]
MSLRRNVFYFENPGPANTVFVIDAVKERLALGDLDVVLVPFTTGKTAEMFSHRLQGVAVVIPISETDAISACKRIAYSDKGLLGSLVRSRLEEVSDLERKKLHREVFDMTFLPFCGDAWTAAREILYAFGHGMKVAVEVSVVSVEVGKMKPQTRVMAVGGTGGGVDTAVITRTSTQQEAFGKQPEKRLTVQEIVAMPIQKYSLDGNRL